MKHLLTIVAFCTLLAACGQKGPLFLPPEAPATTADQPAQTDAKP